MQNEFKVNYIPTKHNSDEANNFNINDLDARDATITLNMLKIKNEPIEYNNGWENFNLSDKFNQLMPRSLDALSN